ncbi:hypothetical protein HmCmsJML030_00650 [Escherichia coli]|nr:hypothetical protein HmCmsJML030_00650 [Escherichia coli]
MAVSLYMGVMGRGKTYEVAVSSTHFGAHETTYQLGLRLMMVKKSRKSEVCVIHLYSK